MAAPNGCDGTCIAIIKSGSNAGQKCGSPAKFGNPVVYCGHHKKYAADPVPAPMPPTPAPPPPAPIGNDAPEPKEDPLPELGPAEPNAQDDAGPAKVDAKVDDAEAFRDLVSKMQDMMEK